MDCQQRSATIARRIEYPVRTVPDAGERAGLVRERRHARHRRQQPSRPTTPIVAGLYAGPQNYQTQLFGNPQASYETDVSVERHLGTTQYFLSGLSKYDNGIDAQHRLQQAVGPVQRHRAVRQRAHRDGESELRPRPHAARHHGQRQHRHQPVRRVLVHARVHESQQAECGWVVADQPVRTGQSVRGCRTRSRRRRQVSRFIGGGTVNWTPWKTEHQSLQVNVVGGADLASRARPALRAADLQVEQRIPTGCPGASVSNTAQINYFNYSINLVHHYTGLSWLDATTSAGFERDRRSNTNPVTVGYNLLAGVDAPDRRHGAEQLLLPHRAARSVAVRAGADHDARPAG